MTNEKLEEIKEKMCDDYCKYPGEVPFKSLLDRCEKCPMNELEVEDGQDR